MRVADQSLAPPARWLAWTGLCAALILSLGGLFVSTQHGMGLGNDSPAFTGSALAHLRGEAVVSLHHPPLFGWLLWAVASATGTDIVPATRFIQVGATVAIIVGVWWQLRWALPKRPEAAAAGALLTAICFPLVEHAGDVGSDQLGAALAVWALGFLTRYLADERHWGWLVGCVVTVGIALLNRFAAFGLALSISTVLWLRHGRPWGRDFLLGLGAGLAMVAPCGLFLMGNVAATGHATSREMVWNGIPWDRIRQSLETLSLWYLPSQIVSWPAGLGLLIVGAGLLSLARTWQSATPEARALLITLIGFGAANFVFLVITISLADYDLALDSRTLLPCAPLSIVLGVLVVGLLPLSTLLSRAVVVLVFLSLIGMAAHRTASLVAGYSVLGRHHAGVGFAQSSLPDFVHAHPEAAFITNDPPLFFNLTRTAYVALPAEYSILTNRRDPDFDATVAALRAQLRGSASSYLVVFDSVDIKSRLDAQRLMAGDRFVRVLNDYFVAIYRYAPSRLGDSK